MHIPADAVLLAFLVSVAVVNAQSNGIFPMSPRQVGTVQEAEPRELLRAVHPFASTRKGTALDLAVPETQRLYGRQPRGPLERREATHRLRNTSKSDHPSSTEKSKRQSKLTNSAKDLNSGEHSEPSPSNLRFPPAQRDVNSSPRCQYNSHKWALHAESTLTYAVMYDRKTGGSCADCLQRCTQRQEGTWTCRSVVYDYTWHICDLFAVTATGEPFTLVDYENRDYFEFLAALPPTDDDLSLANDFAQQQQVPFVEKKEAVQCSDEVHPKVYDTKTQDLGGGTYEATPIETQIETERRESEKAEKSRGRRERKLRKINKERLAVLASPDLETQQTQIVLPASSVSDSTSISLEAEGTTALIEVERTTVANRKESAIEETTPLTSILTEQFSTTVTETTPISTRSIRRKPQRIFRENTSNRKKQKDLSVVQSGENNHEAGKKRDTIQKERNSSQSEKNEQQALKKRKLHEEDPSFSVNLQRQGKKIRRFPAKVVKTDSIVATTTEVIQEMSAELARRKILLYQKRKAEQQKQGPIHKRRRRVRMEGRKLYADASIVQVSADDRQRILPSAEVGKDEEVDVASEISKSQVEPPQRKESRSEKKSVKEGLSRRKKAESQQEVQEILPPTTVLSTLATSTPSVSPATTAGISVHMLRSVLAREIRKFISKELNHKIFRTHGTRIFEEKQGEKISDVEAPPELVPMSKPRKRKELTEILHSTACQEDENVVMLLFVNSTRRPYTAAIEIKETVDEEQCMDVCERSHECSSAVFSSSLCEMSVTRALHTIPDIRPSSGDTYIEKACIERSVIRGRATHIIGVANYILAGFVEQVEDAHGVEECIAACYMALKHYGFHCMSAMWYPLDKDQNCLLNGESRKSQPNLFVPEDTGHQMIYFEHPDAAVFKRMHDEHPAQQHSTKESGWTAWSLCSGKDNSVRYAKCKEYPDVRKCPKETKKCIGVTSASNASISNLQILS